MWPTPVVMVQQKEYRMKLPILISVPHAGLEVPDEVKEICILTEQEIKEDGDEEADEIYFPFKEHVSEFVTTPIARAIIDINRDVNDRRKDGIIKNYTCWNKKVYSDPPSEKLVDSLIKKYYLPYHTKLTEGSRNVVLGVDCHTMAELGPPVGPDPFMKRPYICLSNDDGTCDEKTMMILATYLEEAFGFSVAINKPFKGGFIIKKHAAELPWIQIEFSRANFMDSSEKCGRFFSSLKKWVRYTEKSIFNITEKNKFPVN